MPEDYRKPALRTGYCLILLSFFSAGGCDTARLNSERIAARYGSYGIEVIENEDNVRVSNLYSEGARGRTCRTFAVVRMTDRVDPSFAAEHAKVVRGASIGALFESSGWEIDKSHAYIGEIELDAGATRIAALMRIMLPASAALHVYVLGISKGGQSYDYATIAEVHHPEYLNAAQLRSIYGRGYAGPGDRADILNFIALVRSKFREPEVRNPAASNVWRVSRLRLNSLGNTAHSERMEQ